MEKEKISAIILIVIVIVALFGYIVTKENLFGPEPEEVPIVEMGDCVDLYYIGKFTNGTIFDSSYEDPENKTNGTLLNVYVTKDSTASSPSGYESYMAGMIEGFIDGMVGLKEGQEITIGPIPPEKAYGNKVKIGDTFNTQQIMMNANDYTQSMNITVEVTNLTSDSINLRWINVEDFDKFTMPEGILNDLNSDDQNEWIIIAPPYYIWENSTEIVEINEDNVVVKTTPTSTENITDEIKPIQYDDINTFIFPDATTVTYDDDTITLDNNPEVGKSYEYSISYYGTAITTTILVEAIDEINNTMNISVSYEGYEKEYQDFNKTVSFDREYSINRNFTGISMYYASMLFGEDLQREGLSFVEIAGETLYFDVVIEKVYKTSES